VMSKFVGGVVHQVGTADEVEGQDGDYAAGRQNDLTPLVAEKLGDRRLGYRVALFFLREHRRLVDTQPHV
jgi:hypothetical protein